MKRNYTYIVLLIAVLLTSCEAGNIDPSILDNSIKANGFIKELTTRATKTQWTSGDNIGIYMIEADKSLSDVSVLEKNIKYTTTGDGKFKPASNANTIKFPSDGEKVDFIAYYPYGSISNTFLYSIDVSNQENQEAIDFMYSCNETGLDKSSGSVNMTFCHMLSKIEINIKFKDGVKPENVTATIKGINTKGKFSLIDESLTASAKGNVKMKTNSKGDNAEAILIPTDDLRGASIEIINDNYAYIHDLELSSAIKSFESGVKTSYTLTIDPESDNVSIVVNPNSGISDWKEGPTEEATLGKDHLVTDKENGSNDGNNDGSKEKPYSITEAQKLEGERNMWVKGYIVGYYTGITVKTFSNDMSEDIDIKETCLAMAASPDETNGEKTFPVSLKSGNMRDELNLNSNRDILGTEVAIKGHIDTYFGTIGLKTTLDYVILN